MKKILGYIIMGILFIVVLYQLYSSGRSVIGYMNDGVLPTRYIIEFIFYTVISSLEAVTYIVLVFFMFVRKNTKLLLIISIASVALSVIRYVLFGVMVEVPLRYNKDLLVSLSLVAVPLSYFLYDRVHKIVGIIVFLLGMIYVYNRFSDYFYYNIVYYLEQNGFIFRYMLRALLRIEPLRVVGLFMIFVYYIMGLFDKEESVGV